MSWNPPDDYHPVDGVTVKILTMPAPQVGTAMFKLVVMVSHNKTPADVGLKQAQAQELIDDRMVPTGLYPSVLVVAMGM